MSTKQPCHGTCEICGSECTNGDPNPMSLAEYGARHARPDYRVGLAGLASRKQIAAMALQGMLANGDANGHLADYAKRAVLAADYLIAELNKPTSKE